MRVRRHQGLRTKRLPALLIQDSQFVLYAPRDFDISPFFRVVKPTIETSFNYKQLHWSDLPSLGGEPSSDERSPRRIRSEPSGANSVLPI